MTLSRRVCLATGGGRLQCGVVPWTALMDTTDPARVYVEIDLYHAVNGGADPLAFAEHSHEYVSTLDF